MAKNEISDYDEVDSGNTDISGIGLSDATLIDQLDDIARAQMGALKRWFRLDRFRLRDSTDQTKLVAFSAAGLTAATTRTVTIPDKSGTLAMTSDLTSFASTLDPKKNRMVNGDKAVSQENGQTSGTTTGRYLSDQNAMFFVSSAGTFTGVNVQTISPAGGYRDRITITVADASLAAGEYLTYTQNLEGSNVRDFKWGAAGANQIVIRFGIKAPAGTYAMALHNNGATRSYVALFTITAPQANTDTVQTFAVPGDVTGTWLTADGVIGLTMDIVLAAGTTFQGVAGWQAGNILATSAVSNGMGTAAAVFEFFDVGMRLDPNATGVYGSYEVGYTDAVYRCERYAEIASQPLLITNSASGATLGYGEIPLQTRKCKVPTAVVTTAFQYYSTTIATAMTPTFASITETRVGFQISGATNFFGWVGNGRIIALARLS